MKKWISALLALVMVLSLCACGGSGSGSGGGSAPSAAPSQSAEPTSTPAKNVDLKAFVESLPEKYNDDENPFIASMDMTDPEYKAAMFDPWYPGLDAIPTKQLVAYQPMMSFVVCEIVLVEVENASDVAKVKEILQKRVDDQAAGGAGYPDSIENWEKNSRVVNNGNYVMMIAWNLCDQVVEDFNALF